MQNSFICPLATLVQCTNGDWVRPRKILASKQSSPLARDLNLHHRFLKLNDDYFNKKETAFSGCGRACIGLPQRFCHSKVTQKHEKTGYRLKNVRVTSAFHGYLRCSAGHRPAAGHSSAPVQVLFLELWCLPSTVANTTTLYWLVNHTTTLKTPKLSL